MNGIKGNFLRKKDGSIVWLEDNEVMVLSPNRSVTIFINGLPIERATGKVHAIEGSTAIIDVYGESKLPLSLIENGFFPLPSGEELHIPTIEKIDTSDYEWELHIDWGSNQLPCLMDITYPEVTIEDITHEEEDE